MSLELRDLCVDIAGRRIVTGIGFTVPDGTFAGLLGPNGSGKTTILKAIYRAHRPAAGQVLVDGRDLLALRPRDAARRIAVVAQEFTLEFDFTVAELVMIGRTPHKRAFDRDDNTDRAVTEQAIEHVGCQHLAHRGFNTLSGGEKQRALIARALVNRPAMVILDEPCAGLDPAAREAFLADLEQWAKSPTSPGLVLVTHHIEEIGPWIDHVLVLKDGRPLTSGRTQDILSSEVLGEAFGCQCTVEQSEGRYWLRVLARDASRRRA